jgi:hypothetical protein
MPGKPRSTSSPSVDSEHRKPSMKLSKQIVSGLMVVCLTACGTLSAPPPVVQINKPDPAWTQPVPEPIPEGRDNAALAQWVKALREALALANENLAAVRRWAETQ